MTELEIRNKVIAFIQNQFRTRFRVFDNTISDKRIVAGQFPDIIFMQNEPPPNNNILFVFKIEANDNLVTNVSEWKALGSAPTTFYIVVPESKLDEAKQLASATGVRAKFASYRVDGETIAQVHYE